MLSFTVRVLLLSATISGVAFAQVTATSGTAVVQSDAFVDSVGVNVHLNSTITLYYTNFPYIESSLKEIGIRHLRDAMIVGAHPEYYTRHAQLGAEGFRTMFSTSLTQSEATMQTWPAQVGPAFEAYEYPNELDQYAGELSLLPAFLPVLYNAAESGAAPNAFVVGPSLTLTPSYAQVGNISSYFDYGNLHPYFGGRNPGTVGWGPPDPQGNIYGGIPYDLDYGKIVSGNKPIMITETGYDLAPYFVNYVDEAVMGIYTTRTLFETFKAGIARTYLYELATSNTIPALEDFGLMRKDGTKRPAFYAISNLMGMLADPGASFTPTPLAYTLTGGDSQLHNLVLQKRDGTYFLALWVEKPCWEPDQHYRLPVDPESVSLALPKSFSAATLHQWQEDGSVTDTNLDVKSSYTLSVTDKIMLLELRPDTNTFNLGLTVFPTSGGSVTTNPASIDSNNDFAPGTVVNLTATPNAGYKFTGWSQFVTSSANSINVTMNGSLSLTAQFSCSYSPSNTTASFGASGGTATIGYTSGGGCVAIPVSSASWLKASTGSNAISLTAASNPGVARTATVAIGDSSVLVTQAATTSGSDVTVTLTTNQPGTFFYADGIAYYSGTQVQWKAGDTHILSAPISQQAADGTVYFYKKWDSGLSGAGTTIVTAPAVDTTYNADLSVGSLLIIGTVGSGSVSVSSPGIQYGGFSYYAPWEIVKLVATPSDGCSFSLWKGIPETAPSVDYATKKGKVLLAAFSCPN